MIVDTSVLVDAVTDAGRRGSAARLALATTEETLLAPGHLATELLGALRRIVVDSSQDFELGDVADALANAEAYGVEIDATPWADVRRAAELALGSVRYTDGVFVAMAERMGHALLTADSRLARSGAPINCEVIDLLRQV